MCVYSPVEIIEKDLYFFVQKKMSEIYILLWGTCLVG
jgi:hypothetical protein